MHGSLPHIFSKSRKAMTESVYQMYTFNRVLDRMRDTLENFALASDPEIKSLLTTLSNKLAHRG